MQLYHENEKLRQEIKRMRKENCEMDQDRTFFDSKLAAYLPNILCMRGDKKRVGEGAARKGRVVAGSGGRCVWLVPSLCRELASRTNYVIYSMPCQNSLVCCLVWYN